MIETLQTWVHAQKRRHYTLHLSQDLLGDWVLIRSWGSLDSLSGQIRRQVFASRSDGCSALEKAARRRLSRGYRPMP